MGRPAGKLKKKAQSTSKVPFPWLLILPALLGMILYLPSLGHQWCLDDYSVIVDNWVTRQGWDGIGTHLTEHYRFGYWGGSGELYRPLSLIMFAGEWALFGDNPLPGHLINILLYGLLIGVFTWTLFRWTGHVVFALTVGLLFATHPTHTEVVANIKSRDELLLMFWLVCSWGCWLAAIQKPQPRILPMACAVGCFFLALMSKESAVTFLPLYPLSALFFAAKDQRSKFLGWSGLFAIPAAVFLILRQLILGDVKALHRISLLDNVLASASGTSEQLASALRHIWEYLSILVWPYPLVSDKGWNQIPLTGFSDWRVLAALLIIGLTVTILIRRWRTMPHLAFGLIWAIATFSLSANIVMLIGTSYGERLLFLPGAGLLISLTYLIIQPYHNIYHSPLTLLRRPLGWILLAILTVWSILTLQRIPAWYDSHTLYSTDIQHSPESVKLRYHYALEVGKQAQEMSSESDKQKALQRALQDLDTVIQRHPTYWEAYGTAGLYAYRLGDRDRAMLYYEKAVSLNPNAAIAWSNMGIIYAERGMPEKAMEVYQRAVAADPRFADAWTNLGAIHAQMGRFDAAITAFREALKFDPDNPRLLYMLGSALRDSGNPGEGTPYLEKAKRLNPAL